MTRDDAIGEAVGETFAALSNEQSIAAFRHALRERGYVVARAEPDENMLWTGGRIILEAVGAKPAELAATVYRAMLEAVR